MDVDVTTTVHVKQVDTQVQQPWQPDRFSTTSLMDEARPHLFQCIQRAPREGEDVKGMVRPRQRESPRQHLSRSARLHHEYAMNTVV